RSESEPENSAIDVRAWPDPRRDKRDRHRSNSLTARRLCKHTPTSDLLSQLSGKTSHARFQEKHSSRVPSNATNGSEGTATRPARSRHLDVRHVGKREKHPGRRRRKTFS